MMKQMMLARIMIDTTQTRGGESYERLGNVLRSSEFADKWMRCYPLISYTRGLGLVQMKMNFYGAGSEMGQANITPDAKRNQGILRFVRN